MTEKMTVHKALSELKILGNRIEKEIENSTFASINKHSNQKINGISVADYINQVRDNYKSIKTLISRRNAIKRAVTLSNAKTEVVIGGKTYTVAEAIDMKAFGVEYMRQLMMKMTAEYNSCAKMADAKNGASLDDKADSYMQSLYQGSDLKNMSDEIKKVREAYIASQTVDVLDPVGAVEEAKRIADYIDTFMSDVDSALSVSNALTTVEVEYETF